MNASRPRRLWPALWLVAALLLAQGLAHWHRVEHAQPAAAAAGVGESAWTGHAAGDAECHLLDHLGLADALTTAPAMPPSAAPTGAWTPRVAIHAAWPQAFAAYRARAPPRGPGTQG